jgi:hypothetical protein
VRWRVEWALPDAGGAALPTNRKEGSQARCWCDKESSMEGNEACHVLLHCSQYVDVFNGMAAEEAEGRVGKRVGQHGCEL